ncbi:MAG: imidazole glycerol phosphate synthase subunit HisH [Steroidobacteraceae bacterium]
MTAPAIDAVIVDSGGANLASLQFALQRIGATSSVTADPQAIRRAPRVVLPGVGSAADAMARLVRSGLDRMLPQLTQPVLGICLGMQLLYERSAEGATACLGIVPGTVQRLEPVQGRPVPHMGWNRVRRRAPHALLDGIDDATHFYFVHSYAAPVAGESIAVTDYGADFTAIVVQGNFLGTQFHPERSGPAGAHILANFLRLSPCS